MKLPSNEQLAQIRADFPPRTRVVLEYMDDPLSRIHDKGSYQEL